MTTAFVSTPEHVKRRDARCLTERAAAYSACRATPSPGDGHAWDRTAREPKHPAAGGRTDRPVATRIGFGPRTLAA
jgi:hypothetical protein